MSGLPSIAGASWLRTTSTQRLLKAFSAEPGSIRFVGGCVRNSILREAVSDIDLATSLSPEKVMERLEAADLKCVPTGIEHGTVTAIVDRKPFEITTLRSDVSTDGRRATVAFTDDWHEDAKRRDFTMNALYADPDGHVFDPLNGIDDLLARRVRFIGDAVARIREDYLRILRFFRFSAQYGGGQVDENGLQACIAEADGLNRLSGERIQAELLRLLAARDLMPVLTLMQQAHILERIVPGALPLDRLSRLVERDAKENRVADPVLRLAALMPADAQSVAGLCTYLRFSNNDRARLEAALLPDDRINVYTDEADIKRQIFRIPPEAAIDRLLLTWAASTPGDYEAYRRALDIAGSWQRPVFPLRGDDIITMGVAAGPEVGAILDAMLNWWVYQDFKPGKADLLDEVRRYVFNMR